MCVHYYYKPIQISLVQEISPSSRQHCLQHSSIYTLTAHDISMYTWNNRTVCLLYVYGYSKDEPSTTRTYIGSQSYSSDGTNEAPITLKYEGDDGDDDCKYHRTIGVIRGPSLSYNLNLNSRLLWLKHNNIDLGLQKLLNIQLYKIKVTTYLQSTQSYKL